MTLGVSDAHAEQMALGIIGAMAGMFSDNLASTFFPDDGPYARHLYPKHIEAMALTKTEDVVSIFGGNRVGKTIAEAYMAYCWATGMYPPWWPGHVFLKPTRGWICSQTSSVITQGLQRYLIGPDGNGGLIPRSSIIHVRYSPNALGMADRIQVRHEPTGLVSEVYCKTYDMGRKRAQGDTIDYSIQDEEPPAGWYSEVITRTMTTGGKNVLGFTALDGVTPLVAHLLPQYAGTDAPEEEDETKRAHVFIGWNDVPYAHLSKEKREKMARSYLPHERQARMEGIPSIGSGLVYPVGEEQFVVDADECMRAWKGASPPKYWPRLSAADPGGTPNGSGKTASLTSAYDPDADCIWVYAEYYERFAPIASHVHAWAKKGKWIPMILDPAGASIIDGKGVYAEYVSEMRELNADWPVFKADKRMSLGRAELYDRMTSGRFKIISTCRNFLKEHRSYVINEAGKWVGDHHLLDCARYICRGIAHAALPPQYQRNDTIPEQRFF